MKNKHLVPLCVWVCKLMAITLYFFFCCKNCAPKIQNSRLKSWRAFALWKLGPAARVELYKTSCSGVFRIFLGRVSRWAFTKVNRVLYISYPKWLPKALDWWSKYVSHNFLAEHPLSSLVLDSSTFCSAKYIVWNVFWSSIASFSRVKLKAVEIFALTFGLIWSKNSVNCRGVLF